MKIEVARGGSGWVLTLEPERDSERDQIEHLRDSCGNVEFEQTNDAGLSFALFQECEERHDEEGDDGSAFAHPAWERGVDSVLDTINAVLIGSDMGVGVIYPRRLDDVRRAILELKGKRHE
jgi:hypothetical protein